MKISQKDESYRVGDNDDRYGIKYNLAVKTALGYNRKKNDEFTNILHDYGHVRESLYYKVTKPLYFSPINPNLPPPHGAAPATATLNKPPLAIFSLHREVFLAMLIHGYAYPTYECYKGVENNNPEIEQLRFWCQSWNLVVILTVCERLGDTFISWNVIIGFEV
ncbi:hypothetical protein P8452_10765 [Trifolium repens]|nr:hypothetical protein P8452_10765 [Trifolium repens]